MKIIALMPVKNEAWVLPFTLEILTRFCDVIIVADQDSEDGTRVVCGNFPSVVLFDNHEKGHSNKVRWKLLDAARNFDGNNLLLCVDADEYLPPNLFKMKFQPLQDAMLPGQGIVFSWVQLWKSLDWVRDDNSVWCNNWKTIGFLDDRKVDYNRSSVVINDHTSRVPDSTCRFALKVPDVPLVHLQWVNWERAQLKQAWYRCCELIEGASPEQINEKYAITLDDPAARLSRAPACWFDEVPLGKLMSFDPLRTPWHLKEILAFFDRYGIAFFEELDIWHVDRLNTVFYLHRGRMPARHKTRWRSALKTFLNSLLKIRR